MIENSESNRDWAASVVRQRVERADCPDNYAYVIDELSCYDQQRMYNGNLFTTPKPSWQQRAMERYEAKLANNEIKCD